MPALWFVKSPRLEVAFDITLGVTIFACAFRALDGVTRLVRCAQMVLRALEGVRPADELQVVDVGCGAGGASFELSKGVGKKNDYQVLLKPRDTLWLGEVATKARVGICETQATTGRFCLLLALKVPIKDEVKRLGLFGFACYSR